MQKEMTIANAFSQNNYKTHRKSLVSVQRRWPVACAWTQWSACWYGIHSRSTKPLHKCTVTLLEAHHNSCVQPFAIVACVLAPLFTLLIVPYNSVYYNYIIMMQQLVGWFWGQGKQGLCIGKKVHCGPVETQNHWSFAPSPILNSPNQAQKAHLCIESDKTQHKDL